MNDHNPQIGVGDAISDESTAGLSRAFVFASGEAPEPDEAYKIALKELESRMIEAGAVDVVDIAHQTAVRVLPLEGYDGATLEPMTKDYPLVLVTLHATIRTKTPEWMGDSVAQTRAQRRAAK